MAGWTRASTGDAGPGRQSPQSKALQEFLGQGPLPSPLQETQKEDGSSQVPSTSAPSATRQAWVAHARAAASSLHADGMHGPGRLASTKARGHSRGLGHGLQALLGLPDVMELLELLHHAVFEVRVRDL